MIHDKTQAKTVLDRALNASGTLNDSIFAVIAGASQEEAERYKRAVGRVMGELYCQILQPILQEHPELTPPEMR